MTEPVTEPVTEPCGNEDCVKCHPWPWREISTERVQRLRHVRKIKAPTEAEALRIYNEGTAWPSEYDTQGGEILERHAPVVSLVEESRFTGDDEIYTCWNSPEHQQRLAEFTAKGSAEDDYTSTDYFAATEEATAREVGKPDRRAERRRQDDTTKARLADARYAPIEDAGDLSADDLDALEYHACSSGTSTPQLVRHTLLRACRELRQRRAAEAEAAVATEEAKEPHA